MAGLVKMVITGNLSKSFYYEENALTKNQMTIKTAGGAGSRIELLIS